MCSHVVIQQSDSSHEHQEPMAPLAPLAPLAPRAPVTTAKPIREPEDSQLVMTTTPQRHYKLVEAFDHLYFLETNLKDNDKKHKKLMAYVFQVIGPYIGSPEWDNVGVHVYSSTPFLIKAGVVNVKSRCEIILTIHRGNNKGLFYEMRTIQEDIKCDASSESLLNILSDTVVSFEKVAI